jgi:preprotein translocase subunit YajC
MFISTAYAQAAAPAGGGGDIFMSLLPLVMVFAIFYFLLIRPQQAKMRTHREMLENLKKGDQVVTGGGIVGKVTKVIDDKELEVEIGEGMKVRVVRSGVTEVRVKGEPVKE